MDNEEIKKYPNGLWYINKISRKQFFNERNKQLWNKETRRWYYDNNRSIEAKHNIPNSTS
jgi:hypothetical protein